MTTLYDFRTIQVPLEPIFTETVDIVSNDLTIIPYQCKLVPGLGESYKEFRRVLKIPEDKTVPTPEALKDVLYDLDFLEVDDTNGVVFIFYDCEMHLCAVEDKYLTNLLEMITEVALWQSDTSYCYSGGAPDFIHALPFHVVYQSCTGDFTRSRIACENNHLTTHYVKHLSI